MAKPKRKSGHKKKKSSGTKGGKKTVRKKAAKKQVKRYRQLQDLLGEHQDSQISAALIRRLGAQAGTTGGENGFAFGVLYEQERRRASVARRQACHVADRY